MPLNRAQINAAISDRFNRWSDWLSTQDATPLIVFGLRARDHQVVVTMVQDLPMEKVAEALEAAADAIRLGRVEEELG